MYANLHFHSSYSDGSDKPEDLVRKAKKAGLELISLTDHNTCLGYDKFIEACDFYKVNYILGVELDAKQPELKYCKELLAYFPNGRTDLLHIILINKQLEREERVKRALKRLCDNYQRCDLLYSDLQEMAFKERGFDAPMISNKLTYRYLIQKNVGISSNFEDVQPSAFWKEIWNMENINPKYDLFNLCEKLTHDGAYTVMPHFAYHCKKDPSVMIEHEKLYLERLNQMKQHGLWALEIHPYRMDNRKDAINVIIEKWAKLLNLPLTYGTDYHGSVGSEFIKALGNVPFANHQLLKDFKGFNR